MKEVLNQFIPPIFREIKRRIYKNSQLYYFNRYETWEAALNESIRLGSSYESAYIVDQVDRATQKVRNGEAVYEQDGVCYYQNNNNYELLASILYANSQLKHMNVVDYGGALGSTYFRYSTILDKINVDWTVVEQKHFVERGKMHVPEVKFRYNVDECFDQGSQPNVLLLSSVIMYLDDPYGMLKNMLSHPFNYIIVDESAFLYGEDADDMLVLQHVPPQIYNAIYPCWLFGLNKFKQFINNMGYEIVWEWDYRGGNIPIITKFGYQKTREKGFLLKRK